MSIGSSCEFCFPLNDNQRRKKHDDKGILMLFVNVEHGIQRGNNYVVHKRKLSTKEDFTILNFYWFLLRSLSYEKLFEVLK